MKILFVINGLNVGGAEHMLLRLIKSKCFEGDEITVVSLLHKGDLSVEFESCCDRVFYLNSGKSVFGLIRLFSLIFMIIRLKPDVIHSWLYQADLVSGLCALMVGHRASIWSIRQTDISAVHNRPLTRLVIKLCSLLSSRVPQKIISNSTVAKDVHVLAGYDEKKINVIPNGIDTASFCPNQALRSQLRNELGIEQNQYAVGMLARFDTQKNHHDFFVAAEKVLLEVPNTFFVLCGSGIEPSNLALIKLMNNAQTIKQTKLLGQRKDIPSVINGLDVLVSSSSGEGWPNVVGEAMACGIPCVATDVGDTRQVVGSAGCLVRSGDPEMLAKGIMSILDMKKHERRALGMAARHHIVNCFDLDIVAKKFRTLYSDVIRDSGRVN